MKVIFMGSPDLVLEPLKELQRLHDIGRIELLGVVSQPAKPKGRRKKMTDPAVAEYAKSSGIPVFQPSSAKSADFLDEMRRLEPDLFITAAYGQILSEEFLAIPMRGTINLHPSLLPRYRGATPIQTSLLNGDTETGITILFTVRQLDAGAIIVQHQAKVLADENAEQLGLRMFKLGAELLSEAFEKLKDPEFTGVPQQEPITHCRKILKEDGLIDWGQASHEVLNRFRAFSPWPGSFTHCLGKRVIITSMKSGSEDAETLSENGDFCYIKRVKSLVVRCGDGVVYVDRVKPAGAKEQEAGVFWNGLKLKDKGAFGTHE